MPIEQICNENLTLADLPQKGDARGIFRFGMTFNGYEFYGSLAESGNACRNSSEKSDRTLAELRNELFFCCRASRHMQVDDYIERYEAIYPLLVDKIVAR